MRTTSVKSNLFTALLAVGIIVFLLLTVHCGILQNEKNAELRALQRELDDVSNQGTKLQIEIDRRSDYFTVEKYATEVLGMHKLEKYQIQYIQYEMTGTAELLHSEEDDDFFSRVSKAFSAIGDFFGN